MTNLGLILSTLYPNAAHGDYRVQDNSDGAGPYIAHWDEAKLGLRPDAATLQAAEAGAVAAAAAIQTRRTADATEAANVKADNQVQTFLNFTPAELDAWVDANIPAGGQRTAFKVLGRIALAAGRGKVLR